VPFTWLNEKGTPRADYLSSSRKRLLPQMIYKGGILNSWGKKMAVAIHEGFFETLPELPVVSKTDADIAWLLYTLQRSQKEDKLVLTRKKIVYTSFKEALDRIVLPHPGNVNAFIGILQEKLDDKLDLETPPDNITLSDILRKEKE
jgi:hypothetical protein